MFVYTFLITLSLIFCSLYIFITFFPGTKPWDKPGRFFFLPTFPSHTSSLVARGGSRITWGGGADATVPAPSQTTLLSFYEEKIKYIVKILLLYIVTVNRIKTKNYYLFLRF